MENVPHIIRSTYLFKLNRMKVKYETRKPGKFGTIAEFKKEMLAECGVKMAFYDRFPCGGKIGACQEVVDVKFIDRLRQKNGGCLYLFVFKGYDAKLQRHREVLTKAFAEIKNKPEFRVRYLIRVSLGGLYGYNCDKGFVRVRVTAINLRSKSVNFWAVDEGYFGECPAHFLNFLDDSSLSLEMLVVPALLEEEPTGFLKDKVSEGEWCQAFLQEPVLTDDAGPRKLDLLETVETD